MDNTPPQATDVPQVRADIVCPVSTRPATYSLILALVLRMSPVGMDVLAVVGPAMRSLWLYVSLAGLFYVLILWPLLCMARRHGRAAFEAASKRIIATLLIVVLSIAVDAWVIYSIVSSGTGPDA